jgi:GrpB-like predicted nucleotidyltransferase (UPF0157 family)
MITKDQKKWLEHLSSVDKVALKPYDPNTPKLFREIKKNIISKIGKASIYHRGASYLKISGQDEIDIYVPVAPISFSKYVEKMTKAFGKPGSLYPSIRARFRLNGYQKHIDVFVINKKDKGWIDSEIFTKYLKFNKKILDEYRKIKENANGLSITKYYTKKTVFINKILKLAK